MTGLPFFDDMDKLGGCCKDETLRFRYPRRIENQILTRTQDHEASVVWIQHELKLPRFGQGLHDVTDLILQAVPELDEVDVGLLHLFLKHTSASLTINENADPDVPIDLRRMLDLLAPEDFPYQHTIEGSDDMPGHIKASLTDSSLTIPVRHGRLGLGTWQGIFLCEHRSHAGSRHLIVTLQGERSE